MATIILDYNPRNAVARKTLEYILSLGVFKERRSLSRVEQGLKEYYAGKIEMINPRKEL